MKNDEAILDAAPLARSKALAYLSAGLAAVVGTVFFRDLLNARPAYADSCSTICGARCCGGCSGGWCGNCSPAQSCQGGTTQCWTTCWSGTIYTCCDFYQPSLCTCVGTDGYVC